MARTYHSTIAATSESGITLTGRTNGADVTGFASSEAGEFSSYNTFEQTNHVFPDDPFTEEGFTSAELSGTTEFFSHSGTVTYSSSTVYTAQASRTIYSTSTQTFTNTYNTTTGTTQTRTVTTGTKSTVVWVTRNSAGTGTTSKTSNTTTTTTSTQTNITTGTATTTETKWTTNTATIALAGPYWLATVIEAERTEWLWKMKSDATATGPQIMSVAMESFSSSIFAPAAISSTSTEAAVANKSWTGVEYSTAIVSASTSAVTFHSTTLSTKTVTSLSYTCLPPKTTTTTAAFETLTVASATISFSGVGTSSPAFAAVTTIESVLTYTGFVTTSTTLFLLSINASGADTGRVSTTAVTTKTATSTLTDTCADPIGVAYSDENETNGLSWRHVIFRQTKTESLTFVGGFTLQVPVSGRGIKLPWAIESTLGMHSNIVGMTQTIPWTSWAGVQRTGVTSPLPPFGLTTILSGSTTWVVSWNSSGLYATERTTSNAGSSVAIGHTTHSYIVSGYGANTQTWLTAPASINTATSARYATQGFAAGGTLAISGEGARLWKMPGVLNMGTGTSTTRSLLTASTSETTTHSSLLTWAQETAASISTSTNTNASLAAAPYVILKRNPSVITT